MLFADDFDDKEESESHDKVQIMMMQKLFQSVLHPGHTSFIKSLHFCLISAL